MDVTSHAEDTIKNYLQNKTDFALLITGEWGSGKTYFYEHKIVPLAKSIKVEDSPLPFLPIRISLFGINSIDDLESSIVASIYPFVENKNLKSGLNLATNIAKAFLKHKTGIDLKEISSGGFQVDKKDIIQKQHLLMCFDDLERRGEGLKPTQIIGYINSLVENSNSKVIILSNEDKIDDEDYKLFKEKTIGISISFSQDIESVYKEFVDSNFVKNKPYLNFLTKNNDKILSIFSFAKSNLRIILNSLVRAEAIFNSVNEMNFERKGEALESAMYFSMGLHIEYKLGNLTTPVLEQLSKPTSIFKIDWKRSLEEINTNSHDEEDESPNDAFCRKYLEPSQQYHYYSSIANFIINYSSLDTASLFNDFREFFPDIQGETDEAKTYRLLSNTTFGDLLVTEYKSLTSKLVEYAEQGKYQAIEIVSTFYLSTRLGNPLRLNKSKLTRRLINGLKKANPTFYNGMLSLQLEIPRDHPDYSDMIQISRAAIAINESILRRNKIQTSKAAKEIFEESIPKFLEHISTERGLNGSIFGAISPRQFVSSLRHKFSYNQVILLNRFIKHSHYNRNEEESTKDINFLSRVVNILDNLPKQTLNFHQKITFPELSETIHRRIDAGFREYIHEL